MATAVAYEWDVEEIHTKTGDVIDHSFQTSYNGVKAVLATQSSKGHHFAPVLVCDDDNGRAWAYVDNGKLPSHFADAYGNATRKVPQRFHNEIVKA